MTVLSEHRVFRFFQMSGQAVICTGLLRGIKLSLRFENYQHLHAICLMKRSTPPVCLFVWFPNALVNNKAISRTGAKTDVWRFYLLPHSRQSGETMTSVSAGLTTPAICTRVSNAFQCLSIYPPPPPLKKQKKTFFSTLMQEERK